MSFEHKFQVFISVVCKVFNFILFSGRVLVQDCAGEKKRGILPSERRRGVGYQALARKPLLFSPKIPGQTIYFLPLGFLLLSFSRSAFPEPGFVNF